MEHSPSPRTSSAVKSPGRVVTIGESMALVTSVHSGHLTSGAPMTLGMGGAEANVAIALARLGVDATWIGVVGCDDFGAMIQREVRAEGVHCLAFSAPEPTGIMTKTTPLHGVSSVIYHRTQSAGSTLSPAHISTPAAAEAIAAADIVHITGITLAVSESARAALFQAIDIAHAANTRISFDINHRSSLWTTRTEDPTTAYRTVLNQADIIFAGVEEAALALGMSTPPSESLDPAMLCDALATLLRRESDRRPLIVIKEGTRGAWSLHHGVHEYCPAYDLAARGLTVVDTVGAGDGFVAGYLAGMLGGGVDKHNLELGARVGAFACLSPGDWEGYPFRTDLSLLDDHEPVTR